jgi:hypothetical protein
MFSYDSPNKSQLGYELGVHHDTDSLSRYCSTYLTILLFWVAVQLLYVLFYKYEINGDGMVFYGVLEDGSFGLFWVELTDDDCGSALSTPIQILDDTTVNTIPAADVQ